MSLRSAIKKHGLTLCAAAKLVGVSAPTMSQWCSGNVTIPAERAKVLADVLAIPLHEIRPDLWPKEAA